MRGQVTIFIIIALLLVFGISIMFLFKKENSLEEIECVDDGDCVPANCCHADACVPESEAPECNDIFCTQECAPGTLDCGQGSCRCISSKCSAEIG